MTKSKNGNGNYEVSLNDWAKQEMIANEFITVLSKVILQQIHRTGIISKSAHR